MMFDLKFDQLIACSTIDEIKKNKNKNLGSERVPLLSLENGEYGIHSGQRSVENVSE